MVLIMQWKALKDKNYLSVNISRMRRLTKLSFSDYFNPEFSNEIKKKNFFQNIPSNLATKLFIWRFER